jgi:ubiquinone/menaquinone biosynthesis C-methylase UbiE
VPSLVSLDLEQMFGDKVSHQDIWNVRTGFNTETEFFRQRIEQYGFYDLGHVADIGCGFGRWSVFLAECNDRVTAIDFKEGDLEYGRALAEYLHLDNLEFCKGNVLDLSVWADETFDAVWVFSVLQYVERDVALAEIARVVRPGGRVFFGAVNGVGRAIEKICQGWGSNDPYYVERRDTAIAGMKASVESHAPPSIFTHELIRRLIGEVGLEIDNRYPLLDAKSESLPDDEYRFLNDTKAFIDRFLSDDVFRDYVITNHKRLVRGVEFDFTVPAIKPA